MAGYPGMKSDHIMCDETTGLWAVLFHIVFSQCLSVYFQSLKSGNEGVNKMFDMGDEPDRRPFLERLFAYMDEMGSSITAMPCISKQPIDLFKLFVVVRERGGIVEVGISRIIIRPLLS